MFPPIDWHTVKEALAEAIRARVEDLMCFLIILALLGITLYNCVDVLGDQPRMYRGLTDHNLEIRLAVEGR